jgi:hypothetical protein
VSSLLFTGIAVSLAITHVRYSVYLEALDERIHMILSGTFAYAITLFFAHRAYLYISVHYRHPHAAARQRMGHTSLYMMKESARDPGVHGSGSLARQDCTREKIFVT